MGEGLQSNIPANIEIEEMIVGRLTFKQLTIILIAGAIAFKTAFGLQIMFLRVSLTLIVGITTYLLGFYRLKKYDRLLSEHLYNIAMFGFEQQIFLNKN